MIRRQFLALAAALSLAAPSVHAQTQAPGQGAAGATTEVGGVRFDNAVQVAGTRLQLNGAGVRYKAIFKVYAAALYLGTKATTTEEVIAAPGPKRMHIVMLRDIDANELGKLFTRGMQDNATRAEMAKSIPGTIKLSELFAARKRLGTGDAFYVEYVPGIGTHIVVNGKLQAEPIREPEFFNALLRIWLGNRPAAPELKDELLGKAPTPPDPFKN